MSGYVTDSMETLAEALDAGVREWEDRGGALLPILLRHASGAVRPAAEVRAEALREAADAWDDRSEENLHRLSAMALERYKAGGPSMPAIWLRDRAALAEDVTP